jgi:DNA-binding response OmpR family regulator
MSAKRNILIVEDDDGLCQALAEHLNDGGFAVITAASLEAADALFNSKGACFDAVILDLGLPDGDGRDYCVRLRHQGHQMPVIMLTGAGDAADVVRGLDAGANDYIVKPFRSNELLARLRAQLRLFEHIEQAQLSIGPYTFHPSRGRRPGTAQTSRSHFNETEVAILKFLNRSDVLLVDRQTPLDEVLGHTPAVTRHKLEMYITSLRQKIEASALLDRQLTLGLVPSNARTTHPGYSRAWGQRQEKL